jgi:hypothetical protein
MHQPLAFENLDQRIELQIVARRQRVFACCLAPGVILPIFLVC